MESSFDSDALLRWRDERDELFRAHYTSPIPEKHAAIFTGLKYFDPDPGFVLRGPFTPADGKIDIASSTGALTAYAVAGYADLTFGDQTVLMVVLHGEEGEFFIPFGDETSPGESYGGGRYVPVVVSDTSEAIVDFNRAVNPYCAYDEEFSCPLPPAGNWLPVAVRAGEKDYELE